MPEDTGGRLSRPRWSRNAVLWFLNLAFCASESLPHAAPRALPTSPKAMLGFAFTILGRSALQKIMYGPGALLTLTLSSFFLISGAGAWTRRSTGFVECFPADLAAATMTAKRAASTQCETLARPEMLRAEWHARERDTQRRSKARWGTGRCVCAL